MSKTLPSLRRTLDIMPSPIPESPGFLIRDPLRYSEDIVIIPPLLARGLALFFCGNLCTTVQILVCRSVSSCPGLEAEGPVFPFGQKNRGRMSLSVLAPSFNCAAKFLCFPAQSVARIFLLHFLGKRSRFLFLWKPVYDCAKKRAFMRRYELSSSRPALRQSN